MSPVRADQGRNTRSAAASTNRYRGPHRRVTLFLLEALDQLALPILKLGRIFINAQVSSLGCDDTCQPLLESLN
jgi:hypothetical protein